MLRRTHIPSFPSSAEGFVQRLDENQTDQRCNMAPNNKKNMLNLEKHGSSEDLIKPASVSAVQTLATEATTTEGTV